MSNDIESYNVLRRILAGVQANGRKLDLLVQDIGDQKAYLALIAELKVSEEALEAAIAGQKPNVARVPFSKVNEMANSILDALAAQVKATTDAEQSAVTLINGFAQRVQDAVNAAIAGGATAAELAPVQAEVDAMKASATALAAAVVANTPTPPAPTP